MKKVIVFAMALVAASTLLAKGPSHHGPSHAPVHSSHHHHHHHGSGGAIAAGIVGGALLGGLVASAVSTPPPPPVVTPAPVVVTPAPVVVQPAPVVVAPTPVVVQQPVYQTQNVWVEGRYVDTVQPNGTVLRTWQPGHYEQRTIQVQ